MINAVHRQVRIRNLQVLSFNLMGDGLRDALDPRMER